MERVAGRTYKVQRREFPLVVTIAPKNSTGDAATTVIIGHIREIKNGVEIDERDVEVSDDGGIITYSIPAPQTAGHVDMVQTLLGFFGASEGDTARFEITIETSDGQREGTAIRRPTFNPGTATLKVLV